MTEWTRQWRKRNPDYNKEWMKQYREKYPTRAKEASRRAYQNKKARLRKEELNVNQVGGARQNFSRLRIHARKGSAATLISMMQHGVTDIEDLMNDLLMPCQTRNGFQSTPETIFFNAIMEQAIADYARPRKSFNGHMRSMELIQMDRAQILGWVFGDDAPARCDICCQTLGIDYDAFKEQFWKLAACVHVAEWARSMR